MKQKKKTVLLALAALLAFVLVFAGCDLGLGAGQTSDDFEWTSDGGGIRITSYSGRRGAVTIPERIHGQLVTHIGVRAFYNRQLTRVNIPNSVTYIGHSAFSRNRLSSVTIPNSVTHIGAWAFSDNRLSSVTIPNSVTHIGYRAFFENQLRSVTIPSSVTHIGAQAFSGNRLRNCK